MRNIPMFTVDSGVASLILEEIPYKQMAYIKILSTQMPEQLLRECVAFCKAAGAESIFATGHQYLNIYPMHTIVYEMSILRKELPSADAYAVLVGQDNLTEWISLLNQKMSDVPNAATMTIASAKKFMQENSAYFVYCNCRPIGLGIVSENKIQAIATLVPGRGRDVLYALSERLACEIVTVEVASANCKAMRLYTDLGFGIDKTISEWYSIC